MTFGAEVLDLARERHLAEFLLLCSRCLQAARQHNELQWCLDLDLKDFDSGLSTSRANVIPVAHSQVASTLCRGKKTQNPDSHVSYLDNNGFEG